MATYAHTVYSRICFENLYQKLSFDKLFLMFVPQKKRRRSMTWTDHGRLNDVATQFIKIWVYYAVCRDRIIYEKYPFAQCKLLGHHLSIHIVLTVFSFVVQFKHFCFCFYPFIHAFIDSKTLCFDIHSFHWLNYRRN